MMRVMEVVGWFDVLKAPQTKLVNKVAAAEKAGKTTGHRFLPFFYFHPKRAPKQVKKN